MFDDWRQFSDKQEEVCTRAEATGVSNCRQGGNHKLKMTFADEERRTAGGANISFLFT